MVSNVKKVCILVEATGETGQTAGGRPRVSVINLQGSVGCAGPLNIHSCREVINEAFQGNVKTVILNINSVGGSLTQSDLINTYIKARLL